jgi:hypothetical protein
VFDLKRLDGGFDGDSMDRKADAKRGALLVRKMSENLGKLLSNYRMYY